jgi:hypothetical protein
MFRSALEHGQVRGTIAKTMLAYCDSIIGAVRTDALVAPVIKKYSLKSDDLRTAESAFSYLVVEDIYPLVVNELRDRDAIYQAGMFSSNMQAIGVFLFGVVKIMGGTRFVYQKTADLTPRFANTGVMTCKDVTDHSAVIEFKMFPDLRCTELGCDYRRGLLAATPKTFGGQAAQVTLLSSQARGADRDVYRCEW